jgi:hypothetical protein
MERVPLQLVLDHDPRIEIPSPFHILERTPHLRERLDEGGLLQEGFWKGKKELFG